MKTWITVLALAVAIAGCNGGNKDKEKEGARAQGGGKQEKKAVALERLEQNKSDVVLFLNRAEHVVDDLHYAALELPGGKTIREDGLVYRQLPPRFSTKEKIVNYFARYWSRPIAVQMYDNLNTKLVDGKVYLALPDTDYPMLISTRNTRITMNPTGISAVVTNITHPAYAKQRSVSYHLSRDRKTGRYQIDRRIGPYRAHLYR